MTVAELKRIVDEVAVQRPEAPVKIRFICDDPALEDYMDDVSKVVLSGYAAYGLVLSNGEWSTGTPK